MPEELKTKSCPWCNFPPKIKLGKKIGCQLHGDPSQGVILYCDWKDCPVNPSMGFGDIFRGNDEPKYKSETTREAIIAWNNRLGEPK